MPDVFDTFFKQYQHDISNTYGKYVADIREAKRAQVIKAREYDEGVHNTLLTDRMREFLQVSPEQDFTVNYCPMVVNAKSDRMKVTGFDTDDALSKWLWDIWRKNRMDRKQGILHRATVRDGDGYILVEWDKIAGIPRFYFEPAYDGDGVTAIYSDERRDEMECAIKEWRISIGPNTGKMRRMNVYLPDRVEKYVSYDGAEKGAWMPYSDENAVEMPGKFGQAGVVWWTTTMTESGDPLGIPIVHFKNHDTGQQYGTSQLANVMPIQDAINKAMIDLIATMDVAGFGLLVGTGTEAWTQVDVGPGAIAAVNAKKTEAGLDRLPGENPSGLLSVYQALVMEVARVSGTPLSYLQSSGQVAAEGTMKQQEVALITQVEKAQTDFGNGWEDVMIIARRLHNTFKKRSEPVYSENEIIDTVWKRAESRDDKVFAEYLAILVEKIGITQEQAQVELGYDEDDLIKFANEKRRNQAMAIRQMVNTQSGEQNQNMTQTENTTDDNAAEAA